MLNDPNKRESPLRPGRGPSPKRVRFTESDLAMPRTKPRRLAGFLAVPLAYRLVWLAEKVVGPRVILPFMLGLARLTHRLAQEVTIHCFGWDCVPSIFALSEDMLAETIPLNGSVLDLGCGRGHWSRLAASRAAKVVGIDYSESRLAEARRLTREANVDFVSADIIQFEFEETFDVALMTHFLEHIDDPDKVLHALRRVARSLVIEVPDFESDSLNPVRCFLGCPYEADPDHVREYTTDILRDQLKRNGWAITSLVQRAGAIAAVARLKP